MGISLTLNGWFGRVVGISLSLRAVNNGKHDLIDLAAF